MTVNRRTFLAGVGATLTYAIITGRGVPEVRASDKTVSNHAEMIDRLYPGVHQRDWIQIASNGEVTVYTARNEIGQGLETVITNVVSQALELDPKLVQVRMGDTHLCPNDGPTTGSNATSRIVWGFWLSCAEIRRDLLKLAANHLDYPERQLVYVGGEIRSRSDPQKRVAIGALADNQTRTIRPEQASQTGIEIPVYKDSASVNVQGEDIVTGRRAYAADLSEKEMLYGGFLHPPYHRKLTKPVNVDFTRTLAVPGVRKAAWLRGNRIAVVADSFTAVQKGLKAVGAEWQAPETPAELPTADEIRRHRKFVRVMEKRGEILDGPDDNYTYLAETYQNQHGTQVPIETDSAIAERLEDGFVIKIGTQNPFGTQRIVARHFDIPPEAVRVISMPTGGAFGAKTGHRVGLEAAILADWAGQPVKLVHSREYNIRSRSKYKASVVLDIASHVDENGRVRSRKIDIHQDVGHGTTKLYKIPGIQTALYKTDLPFSRAIMRGTSYTQSVWAIESHMDMLAVACGLDPLDLRRRNVSSRRFLPLIDSCAEMLNYSKPRPEEGRGIGFGLIWHGGRQWGVVGADVSVDRETGAVTVLKMAGAFDIGLLINQLLARTGVESAMLWGMSWALLEEVEIDNHRCHTTGFSNYRIARMQHTPEMDVRFMGKTSAGPRGCGEMPAPAAIAAVSNAVFHATGIRFYTLPIRPEHIRAS